MNAVVIKVENDSSITNLGWHKFNSPKVLGDQITINNQSWIIVHVLQNAIPFVDETKNVVRHYLIEVR